MHRRGFVISEIMIVIVVLALIAGLAVFMTLQGQGISETKSMQKEVTTSSGLKYIDLKEGTGDKVKVGSKVGVIYTGTFRNGEKFDSNVGRAPYDVTVGEGMVIKGWEEGLVGMQKGGKRKLIIPYQLAYGEEGRPPRIPPKAELIFEMELVSHQPK